MTQHNRYLFIRDRLWENGRKDAFVAQLGGGVEGVELPLPTVMTSNGPNRILITEDGPWEWLIGAYDSEDEEDEGVCLVLQVTSRARFAMGHAIVEEYVADRIHGFLARLGL